MTPLLLTIGLSCLLFAFFLFALQNPEPPDPYAAYQKRTRAIYKAVEQASERKKRATERSSPSV